MASSPPYRPRVDDDIQAFAEEFAIPMELAQEAWNVPGATHAQACRFIFALATARQIAESEGRESASQYILAATEAGLL